MKYAMSFIKMQTGELVQFDSLKLQAMFLDYFNNYLSVEKFAEHNLFTMYEAQKIIETGRAAHEHLITLEGKAK